MKDMKGNQKGNQNQNFGRKLIGITQEKEVKILVYSPFHLHKFL